jgi:hypothetical protein
MKKKSSADKAAANSAADSNTGTDSSTTNQSHVQRGQICVSFSVGTSQELQSKMEIFASVESPRPEPSLRESLSSPMGSENFDLARDVDDIMESESVENSLSYLPASGAVRSIQKLQAPATALSFLPATGDNRQNPVERGSRRAFALGDLESNRAQGDSMPPDPMSTRAVMNLKSHASPSKKGSASGAGGKVSYIRVYLPVNRFVFVTVEVASSSTLADVFQAICIKCGFQGIVQVEDFDFYELLLPRFVSVRSAGRPESERWYGKRLNMDAKLGKSGRKCGLHLCHRMAMTTIRLYDDTSTASYHHATPRSLIASAKKNNPAQNRPMEWGEVLLYGSGGKNWDVLRLKSEGSPWSEVVRLNRNAMGNSGVAQVITLTSENLEVTDETSLLRKSQYEVALWSSYGSGRFSETIIATLVPRYVLINCTGESIKYRQDLVPSTSELPPNELKPFHWTSWIAPKFLQVTFSHGQYGWSSRFRINSIGTTYLKLRKSIDQSQIYILQCQIEMVGGTIALVFREESKRWPPYRIDNSTSFRIQFRQAHWSAKDARFDELGPRSTCPYSWDSHDGLECSSATTVSTNDSSSTTNFSNRLIKIRFMRVSSSAGQGIEAFQEDAWMETREYNLDQMSSHKRIQLLRSLPPQLFLKPEKKGFLLKRDNLLKWNKKYFRLYDQMLYYFASEEDQELLGVIDLRSGSSNGSVAIYEKSSDGRAVASGSSGGGGLISLNGFVNSISETIFGSTSALRNGGKGGRNRSTDEDDDDERASRLVQIAVSMTTSSYLCEKSEQFVSAKLEEATAAGISKVPIAKRGFFINSHDLVEFLIDHQHAAHQDQAFVRAQEMILLGVICQVPKFLPGPGKGKDITTSPRENQPHHFQWSKSSWYCVNSINLSEDTDSMDDSGDEAGDVLPPTVLTKSNISSGPQHQKKKTPMPPNPARPTVPPSTHFSIITASKMYELKAKTPSLARSWVSSLKRSIREGAKEHSAATIENDPESIGNNIATTAQGNANANAKTYVHVRVRADGPTKVLELFEGGEEDVDEKELVKSELSSNLSVASLSPTASDVSTVTGHPTSGALSHGGIAIHLRMNSFGISCVNDIPMELMYIYLSGVNVHFSRIQHKMRLKMTLDDIQIDNQNPEATFPKLLCPRIHSDQQKKQLEQQQIEIIEEGIDEESSNTIHESSVEESEESINRRLMADHNFFTCADCKYRQLDIAAMHFCCTWSNEAGSKTEYFEHCSFWLYPLVIQLDEEFVNVTRSFLTLMTQSWDKTTSSEVSNNITQAKNKNERSRKSIPKETMNEALLEFQETTLNEELDPLYGLYSYLEITSASEKRKIYFALLHIHPIECDITYRSDVLQITSTLLVRETSTAMVGMMMTNTTASSNSQKQQELKRAVAS